MFIWEPFRELRFSYLRESAFSLKTPPSPVGDPSSCFLGNYFVSVAVFDFCDLNVYKENWFCRVMREIYYGRR